jgi:hypothetical protein
MKKILLMFAIIATAITVNSCDDDDSNSNGNYTYKVHMTDDPGPFSEVNVDIQAVEITGSNGETVVLNTNEGIYNLLDYANGVDTLIATSTLSDSRVEQIRLILGSENTVVVNGITYPLSTPSAEQSGLKLQIHQDLDADIDNMVLIDFDANASIIQTGNGTYKLKPVLRSVVSAISGNITGSITPVGALASITATSSTGLIYTSTVAVDGHFQITGLPAGTYTVNIVPLVPLLPAIVTDVVVTTGNNTSLGVIALVNN